MKQSIVITLLALFCMSPAIQAFEPPRMHPSDRFLLTLFTDVWQDVPDNIDLRTIQRGISLSALQDMPLGRSNFSVAAGVAFTSHNLYSDNRYEYHVHQNIFDFSPLEEDYDKNKLSLNYLDVPVQLRYRSRDINRTFRLYAGIKAGYLVNAHTKYSGSIHSSDITVKVKQHKLTNISNYRIGLTAMVGYGSVNFHAYYPLTDVFDGNSAEEMVPVSLGITFILF